jgi:hypothetical protein
MALAVPPGANAADSYATVAEADAYFTARGVTTWTGTDANKENALRRATSYLDNQYGDLWRGARATREQALAWPRVDGSRDPWRPSWSYPLIDADGFQIGTDEIPAKLKRACVEAALLALTGVTLEPRLERGGAIKSISKGVGPLSKSITYQDGAPTVDRHTAIEGLLRGLVTGTPGAMTGIVRLVRG